ncbi:Protein of unknown function [Xylanibacter ruminicola]|jgi:hypothetical protein|uniref:DUF2589 domain-containing protein n=1 Tax=Xylanibacter ruminicola TaxID=839 RepID=A0A1M7LR90_XYLRU|nr:DUF2589 domain-containing protein [Xylanibacter ruminicola]MBR2205595.1 DUF2589 domain-containing protein [Prevotella sp.]SFC32323.1 Protein of unknown function [Xylanibacter ruminicola]SHM80203.1 Protein of unknown function [Xylanibacter ruminicola]
METKDQQSISTSNSQVMELQQLIAGPLVSTIEADALSTKRYLDILQAIAFEDEVKDGKTVGRKLRTLSFSYTETNADGHRQKIVSIPLLTLVPLPLLQIQEADFDYDINILDAVSSSVDESFNYGKGRIEQGDKTVKPMRLRAALATTGGSGSTSGQTEQKLSANMKVHVKMRQTDVPAGLANMLRLTASNLLIEDGPTAETASKEGGDDE